MTGGTGGHVEIGGSEQRQVLTGGGLRKFAHAAAARNGRINSFFPWVGLGAADNLIGPRECFFKHIRRRGIVCQPPQQVRAVLDFFGDNVNDAMFALQLTRQHDETGAQHDGAMALEYFRPDDGVGDAGLVLQRHEDHPLGAAGALTHQHQACNRHAAARLNFGELFVTHDPHARQFGTNELHGVCFQRHP